MACNSGAEPICTNLACMPQAQTLPQTGSLTNNHEDSYMASNIINRWLINYPPTILEAITLAIMPVISAIQWMHSVTHLTSADRGVASLLRTPNHRCPYRKPYKQ